jgi:hypothetical protein
MLGEHSNLSYTPSSQLSFKKWRIRSTFEEYQRTCGHIAKSHIDAEGPLTVTDYGNMTPPPLLGPSQYSGIHLLQNVHLFQHLL